MVVQMVETQRIVLTLTDRPIDNVAGDKIPRNVLFSSVKMKIRTQDYLK